MGVHIGDYADTTDREPKSTAMRVFDTIGNVLIATMFVMFAVALIFAPGDDLGGLVKFWVELLGGK